ncbi:MAG TPA: antibiotic biosynthesis monooxygenase [Vicinamibacterales bacterium]|nr:antibiotic biosynthesis monooxygenase [Vicinamibacterales bacterium]
MFVRVWRFAVQSGREGDFEEVYGPSGAWAQLFSRAAGYSGTELQQPQAGSCHYLVVDRWTSREAWETFRREHAAAYECLDADCEALTLSEELVSETET